MYFIVAVYELNKLLQEDVVNIEENKNFQQ
jgi:hypothetical protein